MLIILIHMDSQNAWKQAKGAINAVLFKAWVQVVSRQKLNSNRENIILYSINFDVFSIAIEFFMTNDLDSVFSTLMHPKV